MAAIHARADRLVATLNSDLDARFSAQHVHWLHRRGGVLTCRFSGGCDDRRRTTRPRPAVVDRGEGQIDAVAEVAT